MTAPQAIIAAGYDRIAEPYRDWSRTASARMDALDLLRARLPKGGTVLDLGCGAGTPVAATLAADGMHVTGVDLSVRQIGLAHAAVPGARFIHADMLEVDLEHGHFDAVVAAYSIIHVPRKDHLRLLRRIQAWLKPGGHVLVSLGQTDNPGQTEPFLGSDMFYSHFDAPTTVRLIEDAGFHIEIARDITDIEPPFETFHWVLARTERTKP